MVAVINSIKATRGFFYKEKKVEEMTLHYSFICKSKQLEAAVPASKIATLSSGEFVGTVADDPDNKIVLKAFHAEILNDHAALKAEENAYKPIPLIRKVENAMVQRNYLQIKQEVQEMVDSEIERMGSDPTLSYLIIHKKK